MSLSSDRRGRRRSDGGFSLIEVIVSLGLFSIVLVALLPQLVVSIRATGTAREVTQAKGVGQGQLEKMRQLPFHIAPAAGEYVDVLDYYFVNRSSGTNPTCKNGSSYVVPAEASTGYVDAGVGRCDYEPSSGAFYRTVRTAAASGGITGYTMVIDTQFLSAATPPVPVTPSNGYNAKASGKDNPAASQIGVTVTVLQNRRGTFRPVTSYTQIAERAPSTTRVESEADVRVVDLGTVTPAHVPLSLSAGLVDLTGSLSSSSTVGGTLAATSAGLATGEQSSGASSTLSAPPSLSTTPKPMTDGALSTGGCAYACWGRTSIPGVELDAGNGLPRIGSSDKPAQVLLSDGLSFGNSLTGAYRPELSLSPPLVRLDPSVAPGHSSLSGCGVGATGASAHLSASGYLSTTPQGTSSEVESCAVGRATPLELFPTTFAPHGVVRVELVRASARCRVQGSAHAATATHDYQAVVRYWNGAGYTTAATVEPGATEDPLDSVPLSTSVGNGLTIGHYVSSWSTVTADQIVKTQVAGVAQLQVPGVVKIVSQPTRGGSSSATASESPSATPSPSATAGPSATASESPSATPSPTATAEPSATESVTPSATPSPSVTPLSSATPSPSPTTVADETSAVSLMVGALSCKAEDKR